MIKRILTQLLEPRHFWRTVNFNELSELYVSCMLRGLAVSLLMVFVPFYLYQHGYSIPIIIFTFGCFFLVRAVADFTAGYCVARYGPKHTMIISCFAQIVSAATFLTVPAYHWHPLILALPWAVATSFFFIAYHVAFSKVKHAGHSGKEIGYMTIVDRIGNIFGPLLGGVVGTLFGSSYIFAIATVVLIASLWPLFQTNEPVHTHQKLHFRTFPYHRIKQDLLAYTSLGVENTICLNLWPLYLSVFALGTGVYAKLGILTSLTVVASITSAYYIGRLIDIKHARSVLRISATLNAMIYIFRPFVFGVMPAFATNLVNEAVTTGYRMPFTKGFYAAADDLPGYRIVYIVIMEATGEVAKGMVWLLLAVAAIVFGGHTAITIGFGVAGLASLLIMTEKFKALRPKRGLLGL